MPEKSQLSPPPAFTPQELATEAAREAGMRRGVYAKRVAAGRMSPAEADRRIAMMEAIARQLSRPVRP